MEEINNNIETSLILIKNKEDGIIKWFQIETEFDYKGLKCIVIFTAGGYRCAYVAVPKTHYCYEMSYVILNYIYKIDVHGGLTFANNHTHFSIDDETWWLGFDAAHLFDGLDMYKAFEYGLITEEHYSQYNSIARANLQHFSLQSCIADCKSLVDQLITIDKNHKNKKLLSLE